MSSHSLLLLFFLALTTILIVLADKNASPSSSSNCRPPPFNPRLVATKEDATLKVLVPNIPSGSLRQFHGFCIDVFEMALAILVPASLSYTTIHYTCFNFSLKSPDSTDTLTYDDMIGGVANGSYDVVVGDVTIASHREFEVDFTHEYMESGVVIITKLVKDDVRSEWILFVSPFTWRMWCVVVGSLIFTGAILWILEHKNHLEFTHGSLSKRIYNSFWFMMEALILLERESIKSTIGKLVMVAWVFLVLLLSSSYTAGLSSILTTSNLSPTRYDIQTLKANNESIAYRRGSIVKDYLLTRFHIPNQLKPVRQTLDFVNKITHSDVIAIIDELPYANLILQNLSSSSCKFGITGPQLTSEGFGFGFRRGFEWVDKFSIALMNLTETGSLQELQDNYGMSGTTTKCPTNAQSQKVTWKNSLSVSLPLIFISYLFVIISYIIRFWKRRQCSKNQRPMVILDPSILQVGIERRDRIEHQDLELSMN